MTTDAQQAAIDKTYPAGGDLPQSFSIDLDNHPTSDSRSTVDQAPWMLDTSTYLGKGGPSANQNDGTPNETVSGGGGYGYDPFSGFHWASNVIESPYWDPNYTGQYFYYGAQVGGRTLIEPAAIGGHWASKLGTLTPTHLDLSLSADKQSYSVTSTYSLTSVKGMSAGNSSYTYGPNGFQWKNIDTPLQSLMNQYGSDRITSGVAENVADNNLVPTSVQIVSQYQTPDGNNYTVVKAKNPGSASSSATGAPNINLTDTQKDAYYLVTSKPIDYSKTFDPFQLYTAVMNDDNISYSSKAAFSKTVTMTTGDTGSGRYPAFVALFLTYGITAALSGETIKPNNTGGYAYTAGLPTISGDDLTEIKQLIHDGAAGGVPAYDYSCFLPGTLIRTNEGDRPVESLKTGDLVRVRLAGGQEAFRPVTRMDRQHVVVSNNEPDSFAGWPVLVEKDAFGPDTPSADLRVTAEHCFHFRGNLVPVRMLVNGRNIRYDRNLPRYDHYHLETNPHSLIWANNTLTESWLDTDTLFRIGDDGSRTPYQPTKAERESGVTSLAGLRKLHWGEDSACPLNVDRAFVETVFREIESRSHNRAASGPQAPHTGAISGTSTNANSGNGDLMVRTDDGAIIPPFRRSGNTLFFHLPARLRTGLWLCTQTCSPARAVGPWLDDRRELGCLVGAVSLWHGGREYPVSAHLEQAGLQGWFPREGGPSRWTTERAAIPLPPVEKSGLMAPSLLTVEVLASHAMNALNTA